MRMPRSRRICATRPAQPVYSGASLNIGGFNLQHPLRTAFSSSNGFYNVEQEHTAQSLSLKSNMQREWDWEAVASNMRFGLDTIRCSRHGAAGRRGRRRRERSVDERHRMVHAGSQGILAAAGATAARTR